MADLKDWNALAEPDPEWEAWVKSIGGKAPDIGLFPDITSLRQWMTNAKTAMSAKLGGGIECVRETDHQISVRDGSKIIVRVHAPENPPSGGSPLYVMFHGGGFCLGGLENEELLCRLLAEKYGVVAVNVDYRLAPEHEWPTAAHDCYDATAWAASNASTLNADPTKGFLVGGTSAGGNLAAVISHLWRDNKCSPPLTGTHLMVPSVCSGEFIPEKYRRDYNSFTQNKNAPMLSVKAMHLFSDAYIPNHEDRKDPLFSPLLFPTGQKGFPKTYLQVCGQDPLRDEALIFERVLREEEGVSTKVDVYSGLPHGFWSVAPDLKASKRFVDESVRGVGWLLERE